jgi:glutamate-ammonia-ligase adenylyltransferase
MLPLYFLDSIQNFPAAQHKAAVERGFSALSAKIKSIEDTNLLTQIQAIQSHPQGKALLGYLFGHSPFLTRLAIQQLDFLAKLCVNGVDLSFQEIEKSLELSDSESPAHLMKRLRLAKSRASLLIAIADLTGVWTLEKVTQAMSETAELAVQNVIGFLLEQAPLKGEITFPKGKEKSGLFVLAMGKLGAGELNYSSDIDLIVFFDNERVHYTGRQNSQHFFSKFTQEMVRLLQERTADGYVFRVDLRLRPDPSSTPVAMSVAGALTYYETVGQNWERAAFIKARPIAGDMEAAYQFLNRIGPFIWRKHLDFAAIADIQSIKRQMDAKNNEYIALPEHNIKTGLGGIREIEFFAQIHQLIWGGRMPGLRISGTCKTLQILAAEKLITQELADKLVESYIFLRLVEHRLQMVDDQQTHTLPASAEGRAEIANFCGFPDIASFDDALLDHLNFVHTNFAESFRGTSSLGGDEGKLSFTGVENDPQTLETIRKMGYENPASVSELIQGWHRGSRRSTRTQRARELITELTPRMLKAFAGTPHPDQAFIHFDEFLSKLPAGIQLFSLFYANPQLLDLVATVMGSAPALAEILSKNPHLLDTVLTSEFSRSFPDINILFNELSNQLLSARDFEDEMEIIRRFKNEKQFQAGIQLILHQASTKQVSNYLSDIAETCLKALLYRIEVQFVKKHSKLKPDKLSVIALGRLGIHELTFGSDIDLVFVYDAQASKEHLVENHTLYNKLSGRFITAVTALTHQGRLYEVDTRLRPSGMDGALAVSVSAWEKYFQESAWTFEFMALTRARVVAGNSAIHKKLEHIIKTQLMQRRDSRKLAEDVIQLRSKVAKEFGNNNPWNLKYVRGGLMDIDFIGQYLALLYTHQVTELINKSSPDIFDLLMKRGILPNEIANELKQAYEFLNSLFALLRLCGGGTLDESTAPMGFKHLIASSLKLPDFSHVKVTLVSTLATVSEHFDKLIKA